MSILKVGTPLIYLDRPNIGPPIRIVDVDESGWRNVYLLSNGKKCYSNMIRRNLSVKKLFAIPPPNQLPCGDCNGYGYVKETFDTGDGTLYIKKTCACSDSKPRALATFFIPHSEILKP